MLLSNHGVNFRLTEVNVLNKNMGGNLKTPTQPNYETKYCCEIPVVSVPMLAVTTKVVSRLPNKYRIINEFGH